MNLTNTISKIIKKTTKLENEVNCEKINNKCIQQCTCKILTKDSNNIVRYFENYDLYEWEVQVYLKLIDSKIIPFITCDHYALCYVLDGYVSLRTFLDKKENHNSDKMSLILNELYSFINTFKKYNFVHGNLHIDNIFVKKISNELGENRLTYDFKVIDLVNSYIIDKKKYKKNYIKTSFLAEYEKKEELFFLKYWDFFTIYISLKVFLKNKPDYLYKLQDIVESYIPYKNFNLMLSETLSDKIYEPFNSNFFI